MIFLFQSPSFYAFRWLRLLEFVYYLDLVPQQFQVLSEKIKQSLEIFGVFGFGIVRKSEHDTVCTQMKCKISDCRRRCRAGGVVACLVPSLFFLLLFCLEIFLQLVLEKIAN